MQTGNEVIIINEFDEYYQLTNGIIRAKNPDFHVYRLSEIGKKVVSKMGPFKINYFHLSLGSSLHTHLNVFDKQLVSEDFTLVIFVPGQLIEWERTAEWHGYAIDVKEHYLRQSLNESFRDFDYLFAGAPLVIKMSKEEFNGLAYIYELIRAEQEEGKQENSLMIRNLLRVLLGYIGRLVQKNIDTKQSAATPLSQFSYFDTTSRFKSLVMQEYMNSKSVTYYAERLAITPALLNKSVKVTSDKTAKEIINEVLLLHSKAQLNKPEVAIKEIAAQLNFDDYSHFVKFFKSMTGQTPADYRHNQK